MAAILDEALARPNGEPKRRFNYRPSSKQGGNYLSETKTLDWPVPAAIIGAFLLLWLFFGLVVEEP